MKYEVGDLVYFTTDTIDTLDVKNGKIMNSDDLNEPFIRIKDLDTGVVWQCTIGDILEDQINTGCLGPKDMFSKWYIPQG